jgi:glycopeptide antibiotics resistance protein
VNCQGEITGGRFASGIAPAAAWKSRLWIYLFYLAVLTLAPYHPFLRTVGLLLRSRPLDVLQEILYFSPVDMLNNFILFLPFGFLIPLAFPVRFGGNSANHLVRTVGAGLTVSACIETAQLFLPGRSTTINDLLMNGLGTVVGFRLASVWSSGVRPNPVLGTKRKRRMAAVLAALYGLALAALCVWPAVRNGFQSWKEGFPLIVGNEATGDRPWKGDIAELSLSGGSSVESGDGDRIPEDSSDRGGPASLFAFSFREGKGDTVHSRTPDGKPFRMTAPNLEWSGDGSGIRLTGERPLKNVESADFITRSLRRSSRMFLSVRVRSTDSGQTGPARIVTLSGGTLERNFTLAQDGVDLVFRVRTAQAGPNGSWKRASAPAVFRDGRWHRIDAVFNRGYSGLFVDGRPAGRPLRVPDDYLPDSLKMGESRFSILLFWLSALMPFGYLVSRFFSTRWRRPAGVSAGISLFLLIRFSAWYFLHQPFGF